MGTSWFIIAAQPFKLHCCLFYDSWLRTKWMTWGSLTFQIPLTSCFQERNWSSRKRYPIIWASAKFTAGTQSITKEFPMCLGIMGELCGLLYELLQRVLWRQHEAIFGRPLKEIFIYKHILTFHATISGFAENSNHLIIIIKSKILSHY